MKPGQIVRFKDGSNAGEAHIVLDPAKLDLDERYWVEPGMVALKLVSGGYYGPCYAWIDELEVVK